MIKSIFYTIISLITCATVSAQTSLPALKIAASGKGFETADGKPFFWLGDTGWLLFVKLNRAETIEYLNIRQQQGYNVIQVMVLHDLKHAVNKYGDSALVKGNIAAPAVTPGNNPEDAAAYDFWDHVDFAIDEAAKRGLYMALVPVWGSNVKGGWVTQMQAKKYAAFLAERYKTKSNIIWLNGGDIKGSDSIAVWNQIGSTLKQEDPNHLVTFHPRGRTTSSRWFHQQPWLDFNMFQSGHRNYAQDTSKGETHYGEDNWRYIQEDQAKKPLKPTLDGEPSYEGIPYGLHDTTQPYWNANEVRRYAYWSVLAGGAGFTYGHNAVMQFYQPGDARSAYGAKKYWREALNDPGAVQMHHLSELINSVADEDRRGDQTLVINNGKRYDRVAAARGTDYALLYTYTGKNIQVQMGKIAGKKVLASWFDPRTGEYTEAGSFPNSGTRSFDPPGKPAPGNDWVLILKTADAYQ